MRRQQSRLIEQWRRLHDQQGQSARDQRNAHQMGKRKPFLQIEMADELSSNHEGAGRERKSDRKWKKFEDVVPNQEAQSIKS